MVEQSQKKSYELDSVVSEIQRQVAYWKGPSPPGDAPPDGDARSTDGERRGASSATRKALAPSLDVPNLGTGAVDVPELPIGAII